MRRLLVTGGAGFIGSNFVRYWRANRAQDRLIVLDKLTYAGNLENLRGVEGEGFRFVKGDIGDFELVDRLLKDEGIDAVVNFAAESHVDRSILGPKAFIETNINGTFTLLEAARKNWGEGTGRFIHVSTDEVYGTLGPEGSFTEESPFRPNSPYAASKAGADHLARAYYHTYGLPVMTTNCSNNYGPYQFPEKLIPLMIINALKGRPLPVYGDGLNVRDWIYVDDHCRAIGLVMEKGTAGETYNIGGRNELTNIAIVRLVCDTVDETASTHDSRRLITFVKDRPGHDRRYAIDCSKMERDLGWRPVEAFDAGIRKTVEWYVENREWWERITSGEYAGYYERQYGELAGGAKRQT